MAQNDIHDGIAFALVALGVPLLCSASQRANILTSPSAWPAFARLTWSVPVLQKRWKPAGDETALPYTVSKTY